MRFFYAYSENPCWPLCIINESSIICERNVELGFHKWDKTNTDVSRYLDRLEFDENNNPKWVRYSRDDRWVRLPENEYEQIHWPNGMPCGLSTGCIYKDPEENETEIDVFYRLLKTSTLESLRRAFKLLIATERFKKIINDNPVIPTEDYVL